MSDSIILVVDTNRCPLHYKSIDIFLRTCTNIMARSMKIKFPLRGAIGGGYFYRDGEILISSGLVDAAHYEREQDWLGAVLTPDALNLIEEAKENEIKNNGRSAIDLKSVNFNEIV